MSVAADIQLADPGALVTLYRIDPRLEGTVPVYITPHGPNDLGGDILWAGQAYTRFPIEAAGFEKTGQGKPPRPTLRVANILGIVGAAAIDMQDLVGARVTRTRTFVKYLDSANFAGGNPQADPNQFLDREIWIVDRKAQENKVMVEWELSTAYDVAGVKLPRRQYIQNLCPWPYRGPDCGYTGGPVADVNDQPTTDPAQDACGKRLASCKLRWGATAELPFGGFPAVGLVR